MRVPRKAALVFGALLLAPFLLFSSPPLTTRVDLVADPSSSINANSIADTAADVDDATTEGNDRQGTVRGSGNTGKKQAKENGKTDSPLDNKKAAESIRKLEREVEQLKTKLKNAGSQSQVDKGLVNRTILFGRL